MPYPVGHVFRTPGRRFPISQRSHRFVDSRAAFWVCRTAPSISRRARCQRPDRAPAHPAVRDRVSIPGPTYNEHAASVRDRGWTVLSGRRRRRSVFVHPNNPDGRRLDQARSGWTGSTIIDESFCDTCPEASRWLPMRSDEPGRHCPQELRQVLGPCGLRLGAMIAIAGSLPARMSEALGTVGPCPAPRFEIGARALEDRAWAETTRARLARDAARLDAMMAARGADLVGGTTLFRTYSRGRCFCQLQTRLAKSRIWTRVFPYSEDMGPPRPARG
jgi:cobalamin biosynthetic protein CobC